MEPDAYMSVRHNINEKFARMLPSQVEGSKKQCSLPRHVEVVGNGAQVDQSTVIQGSLGKTT